MRSFLLVMVLLCFCTEVRAEQDPIPQTLVEELTRDLLSLKPDLPPSYGVSLEDAGPWKPAVGLVGNAVTVRKGTPIYKSNDPSAKRIGTIEAGMTVPVTGVASGWYEVAAGQQVGWVESRNVTPVAQLESGWWRDQVTRLLNRAAELRTKWQQNPHIRVSGFSVSLSLVPSLTVDFDFR